MRSLKKGDLDRKRNRPKGARLLARPRRAGARSHRLPESFEHCREHVSSFPSGGRLCRGRAGYTKNRGAWKHTAAEQERIQTPTSESVTLASLSPIMPAVKRVWKKSAAAPEVV